MGLLTFSLNVTLDGCVDHQEGIADDETHAFFTRLMDEGGAMLWGRVTYEMMEGYWPAVARGDEEAPPAMREWAVKLEAKPKYVVSSTRTDFPWTNSHHIAGDLRTSVQKLKDATPAGVLLGSGKLATELDRLDLIDEYKFLVHPRIAGHGPTLYQSGLPSTRRLGCLVDVSLRTPRSLTLRAVQLSPRQVRGEVDMNPPNSAFDRRGCNADVSACWCLRTHEHPND
jgi:dihydrofolate reductase